ncbi:MAG: hypothetical protein ACTSWL_01845, partial [Promethearchaeota archaeon]
DLLHHSSNMRFTTVFSDNFRSIDTSNLIDVFDNPNNIPEPYHYSHYYHYLKPIKVGLGSGWAQSITKIHGTNPIHASAWRTDLKLMKNRFKTKISPYSYQREIFKIKREELINKARIDTRTARKEREKIREVRKKSITSKIKHQ